MTNWTRPQLLIALNLYHKVAFGKFHKRNKMLVDISRRMGRTDSALPMKLSNLASLDPEFLKTGRKGLPGASDFDRTMWAEYHTNLNELAPESEALLAQLLTGDADTPIEVQPNGKVLPVPEGPTESTASVKVRRGQRFFRQAVLNAYGSRCAVTGLAVRELLIASHIIPWNAMEKHRLDPQNGIALNALHDRAFDRGLITFDEHLRLVCAPSLRDHFAHAVVAQHFQAYEGQPLAIPAEAAGPKPEYLEWHRREVFGK
ncbi:MAG: HNH endonuclease [Bacteroidetes bacterium]|nr:HNH endonuclease [Bacteroidota bacterium]